MNKLKLYISRVPADLNLSNYEILSSFDPAELDIMVVFLDSATFDQGYETATALEKYSKPVLVLSRNDSDCKLISSIDHPMYTLVRYSDISEVNNFIEQKVQKHFPKIEVNVCATDVCAF